VRKLSNCPLKIAIQYCQANRKTISAGFQLITAAISPISVTEAGI
jgi:hypothetical protein